MKTLIHADAIETHGQESGGIEGDSLAGPRHLQPELDLGVGEVIYLQDIDNARPSPNGKQPGMRWRPVKRCERREVIVSAEFRVIKSPAARVARGLIELDDSVLQIDVNEAIKRWMS
jgi:hypothetical protein